MDSQLMDPKPRTPFAKSLGAPTPKDYDRLVQRASELSGISMTDLLSSKRTQRVSQWRQSIFFVLRHMGATFQEIGAYFNRTHGTVIHGCNTLERNASNKDVRQIIIDLTKKTDGDPDNQ
jgi:chromosomal replication initiation ATPase DnaA